MIPITLSSNMLLDLLGKIFILSGVSVLLLLLIRFLKLGSSDMRAKIFLALLFLPMVLFLLHVAIISKFSLTDCSLFSLCRTALRIPLRLFGLPQSPEFVNGAFLALAALVALVSSRQLFVVLTGRRFLGKFDLTEGEASKKALRILEEVSQKAGIRRVGLDICRFDHPVALTTGFFRPRILVSSWFVDSLDDEELEAVIAHEVAHIRRRDNLINSLAALAKDILFFLPSSYPAWRSYLQEREKACDDLTISMTKRPLALAGALLKVGKAHTQNSLLARIADPLSPGLSRGASTVQERIRRLASYPDPSRRNAFANCFFGFSVGFLILGMTFVPALSWKEPADTLRADYCCSSMQQKACPDADCSR